MKKYIVISMVIVWCLILIGGFGPSVYAGPSTNTVTPTQVPPPQIGATLQGALTSNSMPDIFGQTAAGATVDIYVDGVLSGSTKAALDGSFSFMPEKPLTEGDHQVTAVAKIDNFQSEKAKEVTITVDTTAPNSPKVTSVASGQRIQSGQITIEGTAEPDSLVKFTFDGETIGSKTADSAGKYSFALNLSDGTHALILTAQDKAGNTSKETKLSIEGFSPVTVGGVLNQVSTASSPAGSVLQAIILASSLGFTNIGIYAYYLVSLIVGLITRRKKTTWGFVYDARKKQPLNLALVRIFDAEYKRLLETRVTDAGGRFGFLVPEGKYYITVTKSDYKFPSELVPGKIDGFYSELYHGEIFTVTVKGAVVKMNAPSDPLEIRKGLAAVAFGARTVLRYVNIPIFVVVLGLSIYNFIAVRSLLTMVSFGVYVLLFGLVLFSERLKKRSWGIVYDANTRQLLPLSIIRLFDEKNHLVATRVTGEDGRFNTFVSPGKYILKVTKEGYQDMPDRSVVVSQEFPFAAMDIALKKK